VPNPVGKTSVCGTTTFLPRSKLGAKRLEAPAEARYPISNIAVLCRSQGSAGHRGPELRQRPAASCRCGQSLFAGGRGRRSTRHPEKITSASASGRLPGAAVASPQRGANTAQVFSSGIGRSGRHCGGTGWHGHEGMYGEKRYCGRRPAVLDVSELITCGRGRGAWVLNERALRNRCRACQEMIRWTFQGTLSK